MVEFNGLKKHGKNQYLDIQQINKELKGVGGSRGGRRNDDDFDLDEMNALVDSDDDLDVKGKAPGISSARDKGQMNKPGAKKEVKKPLYDDLEDLDALEELLL